MEDVDNDINKMLIEAMGFRTYEREYHYRRDCTIQTVYFDPTKPVNRKDNRAKKIPDFTTWEGFGILLSWAKEQVWWYDFVGISQDGLAHDDWEALAIDLVNPAAFATAVYEELTKE